MSDGPGHAVIWPVNDATYAIVAGTATTDEAMAVANDVTFIDEATWRDRYSVPEPDFGHLTNVAASTTVVTMVLATS